MLRYLSFIMILISTVPYCHKGGGSNPLKPDLTPTLFLSAENAGFDNAFNTLHDLPENTSTFFKKAAVIALHQKAPTTETMWDQGCKMAQKVNLTQCDLWLQFDVTNKSELCPVGTKHEACVSKLKSAYLQHASNNTIVGIYFDDEGTGHSVFIREAMESLADEYKLRLAWTKGYNNFPSLCPAGPEDCNRTWDHYLGQMYTTGETTICEAYGDGCNSINSSITGILDWVVKKNPQYNEQWAKGYAVPMVCGGGDCQVTSGNCHKEGSCCLDNRLVTTQIEELFAYTPRPQNMAIWFGSAIQAACNPPINASECHTCTWQQ